MDTLEKRRVIYWRISSSRRMGISTGTVRGFKWKEKSGTKKYSGRTMAEDVRNGYLSSDTHPKSRRLVDGVLLLGKHNETVQWANAMPWNKAEMENAAAR